jgi:hypothetical protein
MANLIVNSNWRQAGASGGPLNFTGTGPITYDNYTYNGSRTCSITMTSGTASDSYDSDINVRGYCAVRFGYVLRAVEPGSIALNAVFKDASGAVLSTLKVPIQDRVTFYFQRQMARFDIPKDAETVKLSMIFEGRVIACTFAAPYAEFI